MATTHRLTSLLSRMEKLTSLQLSEVERVVNSLVACNAKPNVSAASIDSLTRDWPHAPIHRLSGKGTYLVTAGTLHKIHHFNSTERLDYLLDSILLKSKQYQWQLEAWAVFSNHYHFVGHALEDASTLKPFLTHLHADTAREINQQDGVVDRMVWFNYWETALTYEKSYLARLNYVHQNAVKHGLVAAANLYRWCSAAWFERTASPTQVKTIYSFKTDRLKIDDDYEVLEVS
jgi:putative transposase